MEPATLYLLYKLADGSDRMWQRQFPSMEMCEEFVSRVSARKPTDIDLVNSACWPLGKTPPTWVTDRPVYGVPLDPKYRP